jgi:SAM-dependent methyltransferase
LAFVVRNKGVDGHIFDISPIGCKKARANFDLLGLPVTVHQANILEAPIGLRFDAVFSLGLIEHFADPQPVVAAHARLLKPGGVLILGVPNFRGLNWALLKVFRPSVFAWHNLETMHVPAWKAWASPLGLKAEQLGYVGGLEPRLFQSAGRTRAARWANSAWGLAARVLDHVPGVRSVNHRWWSGYGIGVFSKDSIEESKS